MSGSVEPNKSLVATMTAATRPLNNDGDTVVLIDTLGVGKSRTSYTASKVTAGIVVRVGAKIE